MAISLVQSYTQSAANGSDVVVDISINSGGGPSNLLQNDIVLVMGGHSRTGSGSDAGVSTSGYTELFDTTSSVRFSASWKRMGASPDSSVTCIGSGNSADAVVYVVYIFRGVSTITAIDATSTLTESTGQPNSPSITTVTDNVAVISAFLMTIQGLAAISGPSGYSNVKYIDASDTNTVSCGAAWKAIASAGAENPGPWNIFEVSGNAYQAASIALRPDVINTGDLSSTGTGTANFIGSTTPDALLSATGSGTATFSGGAIIGGPLSATGLATAAFIGDATSNQPVPFSMTGTGTASFVGALAGAGSLSATGTAAIVFAGQGLFTVRASMIGRGQAQWVGATSKMESVREDIRSRGAATVNM